MSEAKPTPGPWEVFEGGNFVRVVANGYHERRGHDGYLGGPLSVAEADHHATETYDSDHELALANARLIAAAPELLEACKELVRKVDAGEARSTRSYQQMKAAIAKAEGR